MIASDTFQHFFKLGFYFSCIAWVTAFLLFGRIYIVATWRARRMEPFVTSAILVGALATAESTYYAYLLTFDTANLLARQIAALILAYSLGVSALIYTVTAMWILHHRERP